MRFLELIGRHPWRDRPIFLDPEGAMSATERRRFLNMHHQAQKAAGSKLTLVVAPFHAHEICRPDPGPTLPVLRRLSAIARRSCAALKVRGCAVTSQGIGRSQRTASSSLRVQVTLHSGAVTVEASGTGEMGAVARAAFHTSLLPYDAVLVLRDDAIPGPSSRALHLQLSELKPANFSCMQSHIPAVNARAVLRPIAAGLHSKLAHRVQVSSRHKLINVFAA